MAKNIFSVKDIVFYLYFLFCFRIFNFKSFVAAVWHAARQAVRCDGRRQRGRCAGLSYIIREEPVYNLNGLRCWCGECRYPEDLSWKGGEKVASSSQRSRSLTRRPCPRHFATVQTSETCRDLLIRAAAMSFQHQLAKWHVVAWLRFFNLYSASRHL